MKTGNGERGGDGVESAEKLVVEDGEELSLGTMLGGGAFPRPGDCDASSL